MLKIILNRIKSDEHANRGNLVIYNEDTPIINLQTLENRKKQIPKGTYTLTYNYSYKFKRHLWLISGVRNRYGIRIHPANDYTELKGCIALGLYGNKNMQVLKSRDACALLNKVLDTNTIYSIHVIEI